LLLALPTLVSITILPSRSSTFRPHKLIQTHREEAMLWSWEDDWLIDYTSCDMPPPPLTLWMRSYVWLEFEARLRGGLYMASVIHKYIHMYISAPLAWFSHAGPCNDWKFCARPLIKAAAAFLHCHQYLLATTACTSRQRGA
jgi:hypothetical protein